MSRHSNQFNSIEKTEENSTPQIMKRVPAPISIITDTTKTSSTAASKITTNASSDDDDDDDEEEKSHFRQSESAEKQQVGNKRNNNNTKFPYSTALPSPHGSAHSFDIQVRCFLFSIKIEIF